MTCDEAVEQLVLGRAKGFPVMGETCVQYLYVFEDELYFATYVSSLKYAALTTVLCLFIGYPFAYFMARAKPERQALLLLLVMQGLLPIGF